MSLIHSMTIQEQGVFCSEYVTHKTVPQMQLFRGFWLFCLEKFFIAPKILAFLKMSYSYEGEYFKVDLDVDGVGGLTFWSLYWPGSNFQITY